MRKLMIAILIALVVTYCLGEVAHNHWNIQVNFDQHTLGNTMEFIIAGVVGVVLVLLGMFLAVSVAGVVVFVVALVLGSILLAGLAAFWPVILALSLIIFLTRGKAKNS